MKSTNRKKVLLISGSVILLCMSIIVGVTFALFTDTVTVDNHLQAGDLNITLLRKQLDTYSLDPLTGYLKQAPTDTSIVNFSDTTSDNIFGIVKGETLIVPCCWYEATMEIGNNTQYAKSDAAFSYWIEIKLDTTDLTDQEIEALNLDEQLEITVTSKLGTEKETTTTKTLDQGLNIGSKEEPIGTVEKGGYESFKVKVLFKNLDSDVNNAAKTQGLNFDLIVHAIQATTAP